MTTETSSLSRWLASLAILTALLALPFGARAATYTATGNALFSAAANWTGGKPVSAATTIISFTGNPITITNDVAGNFLLNQLIRPQGIPTFVLNPGSTLEFTNNGANPPLFTNATSGSTFNISGNAGGVQLDKTLIVDGTGTGGVSGNMSITPPISGVGGITKNNANTLTFNGTNANTYTGVTTINAGKISLNKSPNVNAIPGNVTIGNGSAPAILSLATNGQIADTSILTFNGTGANAGIFMMNNQYETIGGLASTGGAGIVENNGATAARTLTLNVNGADQAFDGIIQDSDGTVTGAKTLALTKSGPNKQTLTGVNTYTGGTTVTAGTLSLGASGSIDSSTTVTVQTNSSFQILSSGYTVSLTHELRGAGSITGGTVTVDGVLTPGDPNVGAGTMTLDAVTLDSGCTNNFEFSPVTNDLVNVTTSGGLTINGGYVNLYVTNSTLPFATLGTYNLFKYAGSLGGGAANLTVANPQTGKTYTFGTDITGTYVQVTISAAAASYFWNTDASGSWNLNTDWTGSTVPNAAGATANFGGGGTPITAPRGVSLDANQTVGILNFNSAQSFTISNGITPGWTLTLDNTPNNPTIADSLGSHTVTAPIALPSSGASVSISETVSGASLALNGAISGNGGLTNTGPGTLTLGGANTYSGGTTLANSTVNLNQAAALGAIASTLTINNGVTLDNTSGAGIVNANNNPQVWNNSFTFKGTTNLDLGTGVVTLNGTVTLTVTSNTLTVGGLISAPSGTNYTLFKNGPGELILTGNSAMSGLNCTAGTLTLNAPGGVVASTNTITSSGGTVNVVQSDTIATLGCGGFGVVSGVGTLTVNSNITPNIGANQTNVISVVLAGPAQLKKTGQGMTILSGINSYSGGTWINGPNSKLYVSGSGTLGSASGSLLMDTYGDYLDLGGTTQTVGAVNVGAAGTPLIMITNGTLNASSFTFTNGVISAILGGSGTPLTMDGTGANVLTLAGANTYTGATTVNGGTLLVNGSLAAGSAVAVNAGTLGGSGTINGSVTEAAGANIAPGSGLTNVGILTIVGNLTLSGGGSLTIAATNTSNTGKIVVAGSLSSSAGTTIVLPNPATLPNGNYTLMEVSGTLGGSASDFSVASVSPKTYSIVYQAGIPNKVVLQVTGPANLTWTGDGSGNQWNTFSSGDWVEGGVSSIFGNGSLVAFDNSSTNQAVDISVTVSPASVTVNSTKNYSFSGVGGIGGATSLIKSGSGTLTLATANTYTGATTVNSNSILAISADNNLGAAPVSPAAGHLVLNGGTLSNSASITLSANRGIAISPTIAGGGTIYVVGGQTFTYAGVIADNGGAGALAVNFLGTNSLANLPGTNILSGPNTYSGGTALYAGMLILQGNQTGARGGFVIGDNALNGASTMDVAAGAAVAVDSGNAFTIGRPSTGNGPGANLNVEGTVTNNGTLRVGRSGILNINSGGTWLQTGDMTIQSVGNFPCYMNINAGGTFTYTGVNTIKLNNTGNYIGTSVLTNSGTLITGMGIENNQSAGANTGRSQLTLNGGTLRLTASVTNLVFSSTATPILFTLAGGVAVNSAIDTAGFNATNAVAITGAGSLIKAGAGVLTMTASNTYTGNTTVNGGTLVIQQPSLKTNSTITVASGAVLELDFAVTNSVTNLVLNGVSQPAGVYNSSTLASTAYAGYITGTGSLLVPALASSNINITNSVSGGIMTLTWPSAQLGWYMQSNSVSLSSPTAWHDVPGSQAGTSVSITLDPAQTNVFYRLSQVSTP